MVYLKSSIFFIKNIKLFGYFKKIPYICIVTKNTKRCFIDIFLQKEKKMKTYTDIEQSRKLAEILPLESADGFWEYHNKWLSEGDEWEGYEDYPRAEPYLEYTRTENEWKEDKSDTPCWSLAALLSIIRETIGYTLYGVNNVYISCELGDFKKIETEVYDNEVDACMTMIEKLHELEML